MELVYRSFMVQAEYWERFGLLIMRRGELSNLSYEDTGGA